MQKKMKRSLLPLILAVIMAIWLFAGMSTVTYAYESEATMTELYVSVVTDGNTAPTSGTYSISSTDEMNKLSTYVAQGNNTAGITFYLTESVTLDSSWAGIGVANTLNNSYGTSSVNESTSKSFDGIFDGQNNIITLSGASYGVFGFVGASGKVENFTIASTTTYGVNSTSTGDYVAAAAAFNRGIIENITNNARVYAALAYNVGGICGFNDGYNKSGSTAIINCTNAANVTGYQKVGGIAGENAGLISVCTNSGTIKGQNTSSKNGVGGITGRNGNNNTARETGIIETCLNKGSAGSSGQKWVGGITGFQNSLSRTNSCLNVGTVTGGTSYVNAIIGNNEGAANTENYAVAGTCTGTGNASEKGTEASNFTISTLGSARNTAIVSENPWTVSGGTYALSNVAVTVVRNTTISDSVSAVTVYLGGTNASDSNGGTSDAPVATLSKAKELVSAGGAGSKIYVNSTITISSDISIFQNIDIIWNGTTGGTMFNLTAGALTFGSVDLVGDGITTAGADISVTGGMLKLHNGTTVSGAATGIDMDGGDVYLSHSSVNSIDLASGCYINLQSKLTNNTTITVENPSRGTVVAKASDAAMAQNSCEKVLISNTGYSAASFWANIILTTS